MAAARNTENDREFAPEKRHLPVNVEGLRARVSPVDGEQRSRDSMDKGLERITFETRVLHRNPTWSDINAIHV